MIFSSPTKENVTETVVKELQGRKWRQLPPPPHTHFLAEKKLPPYSHFDTFVQKTCQILVVQSNLVIRNFLVMGNGSYTNMFLITKFDCISKN